jgi:hypothetical protein
MMFSYKDHGISANTKCVGCEETAKNIRKQYGDCAIEDGSFSSKLGGWVCYPCAESMESEPQGTVIVFRPRERTATKYEVMENEDLCGETELNDPSELENLNIEMCDYGESPIQFVYVRTGGWRGYYEPKAEGWKVLHSDCALAYSGDERQLKEFDIDIKKTLWELGFEFAVCFGRTSNLFSTGYDVLIHENEEQDIVKKTALCAKLVELKARFRDPTRFNLTALTGKSDGFDEKDELLLEASQRLQNGEDFETVKQYVLGRAKEGTP